MDGAPPSRLEPRVASPWDGNGISDRLRSFGDRHLLTHREVEIVHHLLLGLANKEIAERCCIAEHTVKDHLKHVYQKTGVHQRAALLAMVFRSTGLAGDQP